MKTNSLSDKKRPTFISMIILLVMFFVCPPVWAANQALLLEVTGAIGPATQDYIERGLIDAEKNKMTLVIIRMDTPGGLDSSMRGINKAILSSNIPVVTYVAPSGARAASAGTYIMYASTIAAMAPGTHLGAASPVMMGEIPNPGKEDDKHQDDNASTLKRKATEDAVAYIHSLATLHGRNAEWAEKAVRQAVSLSAEEAYKMKVIDIVSDNVSSLLNSINGRVVKVNNASITLNTTGVEIVNHLPDWRYQFLSMITDPNIAYILLLIGIYGLFFELSNPGLILPGIAGAIALVISLYAFQLLPVNYAGFALLLLGMLFIILEAFVSSFGALGIGGLIAFTVGSIFLLDTEAPGYGISWSVIITMTLLTASFLFVIANLAIGSFKRKVVTGYEGLIGKTGYVLEINHNTLLVKVGGEIWQATSDHPLKPGQKISVKAVNGLQLTVEPLEFISQGDKK